MSASSAADWCRAVLEEVTPSPLNNVPPLPAHVPVPPPPPPQYAVASRPSATKSATAAASSSESGATVTSVAQPSAQYQAYYNQYYQQAYAASQAQTVSSSYTQYQQVQAQHAQQQQPAGVYQQPLQNYQHQQQQQNAHALYYQQPSYTSVVQHGTAAWQNAAGNQAQTQGQGRDKHVTSQQQTATAQQYAEQQYLAQQHAQQQQASKKSVTTPLAKQVVSSSAAADSKKPHKSRFSSAPETQTAKSSNVTNEMRAEYSDKGEKPTAGDSGMPSTWPTSLKNFVARSFGLCKTDEDRQSVSQALEKLINKVAFDGRVNTHRWDLEDVSACIIPVAVVPVRTTAVSTYSDNKSWEKTASPRSRAEVAESQQSSYRANSNTSATAGNGRSFGSGDTAYSSSVYGPGSSGGNGGGNASTYGGASTYGSSGGALSSTISYDSSSSAKNGNALEQPGAHSPHSKNRFGPSPAPSPLSLSAKDAAKKRKNRWDTESNGSNGDLDPSHSIMKDKGKQPNNNENKKKAQKMTDISDTYGPQGKKNEPANKIIENPASKAEKAMREKRASRFKEGEDKDNSTTPVAVFQGASLHSQSQIQLGMKNKMKKRNGMMNPYHTANNGNGNHAANAVGDFDFESLIVIGTCQKLEKEYFRLTSAPLPSTVRPEEVLRQSIALVQRKWEQNAVEYVYMCSQFKSIRQDLTVQHIQNDLTVEVYERHARVALECRDLNEYNQCQTQLKQLYSTIRTKGLPVCGSEMEFTAYRILYYVYLQGNKKYQNGSSDLADIMSSLTPNAFKDPAVAHALQVRQSVQLDNYHKFFRLYHDTPNLGNHIIDLMTDNKRLLALQKVVRSYKPSVPVTFVTAMLNFDDEEEGVEFLKKAGCILEESKEINSLGISMTHLGINTKDSIVDTSVILHQDKLLL